MTKDGNMCAEAWLNQAETANTATANATELSLTPLVDDLFIITPIFIVFFIIETCLKLHHL